MELYTPTKACGYAVLINTPAWLTEQAENVRYEFVEKSIQAPKRALTSQIPLVNLLAVQSDGLDEKVVSSIKRVTSIIHCFQVAYTGFSFFDAEESFRVNFKNEDSLVSLSDLIQGELSACQLLPNTATRPFGHASATSHTLTAGSTYYEFTDASTTNDFRVEGLSVLKKVAGSVSWELLAEIPFGRA